MYYIKHLFYIWKPWKWKLIDSCRNALSCGRPGILSRPAITHIPLNSFLRWKHKKWFQEGKSLHGNLASFHESWIVLLFPDLQYEIVSWNWVSAVLARRQPCSGWRRLHVLRWPCPWTGHWGVQSVWRMESRCPEGQSTASIRTVGETTKAKRGVPEAARRQGPAWTRLKLQLSCHED